VAATSLRRLRIKLTLWYFATLSAIIILLGGGLFFAIGHRLSRDLQRSLRAATTQLESAAHTRELESGVRGQVMDAVEELHIADRTLYLLDTAGTPITPARAPEWVQAAARGVGAAGVLDVERKERRDDRVKLHAERFALSNGQPRIAAAVANEIELRDRYSELIAEFGAAAAIALLLVTCGGWLLVRQSTAPIERSMAQMRRFMADAAHELRTPITVLRTQAEVTLQRDRDADEYRKSLRSIESEGRRMGRIVDDLLTLARADSGDRPVTPVRVFLDDIVVDAVGAVGAMAAARGVSMTLEGFEEAAVNGDAELLRQLVMILLDNAIKFTPSGGKIDVRVGVREDSATVAVADNGPGIAPEQLPHIFERFYRGDPARSRGDNAPAASGAGLGLSIAQWIAQAQQATIAVTSEPGRGTTVIVKFPVAVARSPVSSS
jgi:signal transduction histidine kinase